MTTFDVKITRQYDESWGYIIMQDNYPRDTYKEVARGMDYATEYGAAYHAAEQRDALKDSAMEVNTEGKQEIPVVRWFR